MNRASSSRPRMRMPGFTAEAATDTTANLYLAGSAQHDGEAMRRVTPQAIRFGPLAGSGTGSSRGECYTGCLCGTEEGCPCCPPASGSGPRVRPGLLGARR